MEEIEIETEVVNTVEKTEEKLFEFRRANKEDITSVREMIQELAEFEEAGDSPQLTEEDLIRDGGIEGDAGCCHIWVLDYFKGSEAPKVIGYAICFFSYSTWKGKTYFLEDLYVRPKYRGLGAGRFLFRAIAAKANEYNCKRLDFHVLLWNPAIGFYKKMGAVNMTMIEHWQYYRVFEEQIKNLAAES